ncbi:hypothetical protein [Burkholderia ubonensis]|uniref:hypothetical protein n=1 Tax=Burkholderia ubonensis TaxID=101571 RepID=UPI00075AC705|nr:hypothetical protein [Burkholderia ubonensis]KVM72542.1 hypothetical protein WJ61_00850 [Burkholderia ubonensis]KVP74056.1 hypothetical protein WJ94_22415 [Burkholderia ubonensis]KVQ11481.1 hypothetical protein WJ99_15835 [Burkholderia ubonensis]KVR52364.1 hypothetical protein WK19_22490 [Burkholderia ubonensis]KVU74142.1 hypothetical protein WK72_05365 [Burkholderia ubonensis]
MEIKIEKPFRLRLDVVETDEHVPSMRMQVMIDVQQFGHRLEYRGNVWIDCSAWDTFVAGLNAIGEGKAELVDMGGHFTLWLEVVSEKSTISWEMRKADITGAVAAAAFCSPIDEDTLAHLKNQFAQFDRWW